MILLLSIVLVVLVVVLLRNIDSAMTPVIVLPMLLVMALLGYELYRNPDSPMELWNGIQNAPAAVWEYLKASLNEILDGMTAWAWIGFGLTGLILFSVVLLISWFSGRALRSVQLNRAEARAAAAERRAADEREKARQAEQVAAQERKRADHEESLRHAAERRSQGMQGQLDQAVKLADNRGKENKDLRADKKRLQADNEGLQVEVAELRAQLPASQHKAIVTPLVRERRGSTKRETRTGP